MVPPLPPALPPPDPRREGDCHMRPGDDDSPTNAAGRGRGGLANPGSGNATQSRKVDNLINVVKRAETRGIGQQSVADKAFTIKFSDRLLILFRNNTEK